MDCMGSQVRASYDTLVLDCSGKDGNAIYGLVSLKLTGTFAPSIMPINNYSFHAAGGFVKHETV
jgi:hypothetical protein